MTEPIHFNPSAQGPLHGIRVVDLSRLVAGNMLSLQLGDFGADVIKVEPPEGDPLRQWKDEGHALFWKIYGRNKRSLALNLREAGGMAALRALLATADVFIENFRPGTLEQMGLAPDTLLAANPNLIIVRISGFGQTGPYAGLPGFGSIVEGMSGFAHRNGFADREPVLPPLALADMIAGVYGASAVTTALFARQRGDAKGQVIDLSLLEPIVSVLGPEAALYKVTGKTKMRSGSASNTSSPRNVYRARDGKYLAVSGSTPQVARRIFEIIGRPDMLDDPRFATNEARVKHRALVDEAVGAWFAEHDHDEALRLMRESGATVGPIFSPADAAEDPHFVERGVTVAADDADYGELPMHNIVPRLSATPGVWAAPCPDPGRAQCRNPRRARTRMRLRSLLYVPAHSERFLSKAHERGADAIILDLEDAVPAADKDAARKGLAEAVKSAGRNGASVFVRVNSGARRRDDVEAAVKSGANGIVLAKAELGDLANFGVPLIAMLESPGAVLDARLYARHPNVMGLVVGSEDLATELGATPTPDVLRVPKLLVHYAAKAEGKFSFGLLRSVADYQDLAAIEAAAREARQHGFDGATCVHPSAVAILNAAFSPSLEEIAWAGRVLEAAKGGAGAFAVDGRMVDAPVIARARSILEQ